MTRASKITIILTLIVVALFVITRVSDDSHNQNFLEAYQENYTFTTEDGWKGILTYTSKDKSTATLNIRNQDHELLRTKSASGAKYESEDKTVTFWEQNGEATIEAAGLTYQVPSLQKADVITMSISAEKKDCVGVTPQKCLVVNDELFYDERKGFGFEEGVEYEIKVARTKKEKVPADASSYEYELIKVLSATPVKEKPNKIYFDTEEKVWKDNYGICHTCTPENGFGADGSFINETGTTIPMHPSWDKNNDGINDCETDDTCDHTVDYTQPRPSDIKINMSHNSPEGSSWQYNSGTVSFKEGRYMADFGCNSISGGFTVEDNILNFKHPITTEMYCSEELAKKEQDFSNLIIKMTTFSELENGAELSDSDGEQTMKLELAN